MPSSRACAVSPLPSSCALRLASRNARAAAPPPRMPSCWTFLLKRLSAASKLSLSPTTTSVNRRHPPSNALLRARAIGAEPAAICLLSIGTYSSPSMARATSPSTMRCRPEDERESGYRDGADSQSRRRFRPRTASSARDAATGEVRVGCRWRARPPGAIRVGSPGSRSLSLTAWARAVRQAPRRHRRQFSWRSRH